jgi:uncharacterized protein YggE
VASPGITVGATAQVSGTPDTLRLDLSVVATAPSVSAALAKANSSAQAVQKSLLANGVAKADVQTSGLNISPTYASNGPTPRITGYEVSQGVNAKLRDLGRAGAAIGKVVDAGDNAIRVNGISLDLEDTGALVSQARAKAFADAKAKGEQYAEAAGRPLGAVLSITESTADPSPVPLAYAQGAAAASKSMDVPLQPGSQKVAVTVSLVFAMG